MDESRRSDAAEANVQALANASSCACSIADIGSCPVNAHADTLPLEPSGKVLPPEFGGKGNMDERGE